jgi:predicted oxidoreductase
MYGYGKAETALGKVLKESPGLRQTVVIQSKCGERFKEGWIVDSSHDYIIQSVEGSLKRLGTDYLDLLLLHYPDSLIEPEEVARAFDELKQSGKVRYFGVSNYAPYQIELLNKFLRQRLVTNQIQLSLAYWYVPAANGWKANLTHGVESALTLDYCRLNEIQVQAYSPLKGSDIGKAPAILNPPVDASPQLKKLTQMLASVAKDHDATPAAVMLAWLLRHPAGIIPIVGGTKSGHLVENFVADRIALTREQWYGLLEAAAALQYPQSG